MAVNPPWDKNEVILLKISACYQLESKCLSLGSATIICHFQDVKIRCKDCNQPGSLWDTLGRRGKEDGEEGGEEEGGGRRKTGCLG